MSTLKERILAVLTRQPGLTDRGITNLVRGNGEAQQPVNQTCRELEAAGVVARRRRDDGLIGNYPIGVDSRASAAPAGPGPAVRSKGSTPEGFAEDALKAALAKWLEAEGWTAKVAWGQARGVDIEAFKDGKR